MRNCSLFYCTSSKCPYVNFERFKVSLGNEMRNSSSFSSHLNDCGCNYFTSPIPYKINIYIVCQFEWSTHSMCYLHSHQLDQGVPFVLGNRHFPKSKKISRISREIATVTRRRSPISISMFTRFHCWISYQICDLFARRHYMMLLRSFYFSHTWGPSAPCGPGAPRTPGSP